MDLTGLTDKINDSVINIYAGRKGFATKGMEAEGRVSYEVGIDMASEAFGEAKASAEVQTIVLAEYTFILQELELCPEADNYSLKSLDQARQSFDDAFLALQVVENGANYREADKTHPHHRTYRVSGFPKDSFHVACVSHRTRLQNILRSPGIDPIEKALLKQRGSNLTTAQSEYIDKQRKALRGG